VIVYVESNFLLELALGQEEREFAAEILALAERRLIDLAYPAFALGEPFSTVSHRARERDRLASQVAAQVRELGRSAPHQQLAATLQHVPAALAGIGKVEFDLLEESVARLLAAGRGLQTDSDSFRRALTYQRRYDLEPMDAVIYAAVVVDMEQHPTGLAKSFVSRNWKDFDDPGIRDELRSYGCRYDESFEAALAFIRDNGLGL
jgi:predicted nucleic acid-binding protein